MVYTGLFRTKPKLLAEILICIVTLREFARYYTFRIVVIGLITIFYIGVRLKALGKISL